MPSVPGQYELQNEHLTKKDQEERNREGGKTKMEGRREGERVRILK